MRARIGFTLLELVFVIVIMGILAKFGVELLAQAYSSYIHQKVYSELQAKSEMAVEFIAKRLEYRIKDSTIARTDETNTSITPISEASGENYTVLEWIGYDNDGFRGYYNGANSRFQPAWSGIIDLNNSSGSELYSPDTNTTVANDIIKALSKNNTTIDDAALYFLGANSDVMNDYGWDGNAITDQSKAMHPVKSVSGNVEKFAPAVGSFSGTDVYEYYQLAWTAYAVVLKNYNTTTHTGTLMLYYNYQPWKGERLSDGASTGKKAEIIMENVSAFRFMSIGSIIKIQVCVKSDILSDDGGDYGICKEKTVM